MTINGFGGPHFSECSLQLLVAVGIGISPDPPHRSVQALASAYGSYLGYERQSVFLAKDAEVAVSEAIDPVID